MESKTEEKFVLKQAEEDLKRKQEKEEEKGVAKKEELAAVKPEEKQEKKEEEKEKEKKREVVLERIYSIPVKLFLVGKPRMKRHTSTAGVVRRFAAKHLKVSEEKVRMDGRVAEALSKSGRSRLLKKIKVKMSKDKDGLVLIELAA